MDFELVFWCVVSICAIGAFFWLANASENDEPVPTRTIKRLCGEWYK